MMNKGINQGTRPKLGEYCTCPFCNEVAVGHDGTCRWCGNEMFPEVSE